LLLSAAYSGAAGLALDGFEQIGRVAVGEEPISYTELGKKFLFNATTGLICGAIGAALMRCVGRPLVKLIASNKTVSKQATRLVRFLPNRVYQAEINAVADELAKKGAGVSVEEFIKLLSHERIEIQALTKFFVDVGTTGLEIYISNRKDVKDRIDAWVKDNPDKLSGKDESAIAEAAAEELVKSNLVDQIYEDLLKQREGDFRKRLRQELLIEGERLAKQR
jgi:hypothetical protein